MTGKSNNSGLSLFEMLVVVTIVGVLAVAAVPVAEISYIKAQETLLEENLETIRAAITAWKADCRMAIIRQIQSDPNAADIIVDMPDSKLYPPSLGALANPPASLDRTWDYGVLSISYTATFYPRQYLQRIPIDPFVGAPVWDLHYASGTLVGTFDNGETTPPGVEGLFDVSPTADSGKRRGFVQAIDGTKYEDW